MKIVVDKDIPFIEGRFPGDVEVIYAGGKYINPEMVKDADAVIVRTRTKCDENLLKNSKVKLVATATIGTDHIDVDWCKKAGIHVKNAPGCNAPGVAQYVFSSLFKSGFDPAAHTLGIIGYGNVGSLVGRWAQEMGINFLVNDPPKEKRELGEVNYTSLKELLQKSDAVTLHVPYTSAGEFPTRYLISKNELEMMKSDAILVNSSRGGVVNEMNLCALLKAGRIKAITDVWENEPEINEELARLSLISTPHIAGYSAEGKMRATRMVLEAIQEFFLVPVDMSGLDCKPSIESKISRPLIENSYNPLNDTQRLLENISSFETLRNSYTYRHEPFFNI